MRKPETHDIAQLLEELRAQVAELSRRLERYEGANPAPAAPAGAGASEPPAPAGEQPAPVAGHAAKAEAAAKAEPAAEAEAPAISEEEVLAVSAALAAYFGVRMRIRSIRLMGSPAWAQQGRVSIQASHRLHS